ncbi:S41 family peptidase [Aquabacterium humicola]|uniref:S41 family peptidase n=1 Tax=Aquabacterium humicola TaxID=3237377 RepID=UPI00254355A3|nr:S41 family peptidase [Rubrivivax pictus]
MRLLGLLALSLLTASTCLAQSTDAPPPGDEAASLAAAISILKSNFFRPLTDAESASRSIEQLVQAIDPDLGEYIGPQDVAAFRQGSRTRAKALGISLRRQRGDVLVLPLPDSPASSAGLHFGDRLIEIDGQRIDKLPLWRVHKLLSDRSEAAVVIVVGRAGQRLSFTVRSAATNVDAGAVTVQHPAPGVLWLRVPDLAEATLAQTAGFIASEWRTAPPSALILDLRGNSGGLFQSAVGHASIFLDSTKLIATLRSHAAIASNLRFMARPEYYTRRNEVDSLADLPPAIKTIPLAVLIDEATAAGAELIVAAIKDHGRGLVVGRRSGGFASIQTISLLPNGGGIKYTSAHWEPPSAVAVDGIGISPDIDAAGTDHGAFLAAALLAIEKQRTVNGGGR